MKKILFIFCLTFLFGCSSSNDAPEPTLSNTELLVWNSPWFHTHYEVTEILEIEGTNFTTAQLTDRLNENNDLSTHYLIFNNDDTGTNVIQSSGNNDIFRNFQWSVNSNQLEIQYPNSEPKATNFTVNNNQLTLEAIGEIHIYNTTPNTYIKYKVRSYYNKNLSN